MYRVLQSLHVISRTKMARVGMALVQSLSEMDVAPGARQVSSRKSEDSTSSSSDESSVAKLRTHLPDDLHPERIVDALKDLFFPSNSPKSLHNPSSVQSLVQQLQKPGVDANARNVNGDAPIHAIVKRKKRNWEKLDLLVALLTYSNADVHLQTVNNMTALHLAAQACDIQSSKALVAFGAEVNIKNVHQKTPLDLVEGPHRFIHAIEGVGMTQKHSEELSLLLREIGAMRASKMGLYRSPLEVLPFPDTVFRSRGEKQTKSTAASTWASQLTTRYSELENSIDQRLSNVSVPLSPDEAMSLAMQMRELRIYRSAGSRILSLDGGGMRGLIQIEILSQIERATGRKITELFDWIIGSSTGGIVALGLVYAKKSLSQLRQLYFKMKDEIFGNARAGIAFNTEALEKILKDEMGDFSMNDIKYPRVLIPAVYKHTINPKLHTFNNCFDDEFSTQPVWKVAQYTSAAPMFFNEVDDYVDAGLLAQNPIDSGLSRIQNHYREHGQKLPISIVVSVGSGKQPEKELGSIDARDFFFFGTHWFDLTQESFVDKAKNFVTLLSNTLVEAEVVAENCRIRCREQGILYYRFSPQLEEEIESGETNSAKLLDMILAARKQIPDRMDFGEMVVHFHRLANASRKIHGIRNVSPTVGSRRKS